MCVFYLECCVGWKSGFGHHVQSLFSLVEQDIALQGDGNGLSEKTQVDSDTHKRYHTGEFLLMQRQCLQRQQLQILPVESRAQGFLR